MKHNRSRVCPCAVTPCTHDKQLVQVYVGFPQRLYRVKSYKMDVEIGSGSRRPATPLPPKMAATGTSPFFGTVSYLAPQAVLWGYLSLRNSHMVSTQAYTLLLRACAISCARIQLLSLLVHTNWLYSAC